MASPEMKKEAAVQPAANAFDVFLSYSHKDHEFAVRMEEALEGYRIPRGLRGVVERLNVFRDEADITAGDDYYRTIERNLRGSAKLVVICSPDARRSKFVADEINRFIAAHGTVDIIPVLARGKANNEATDESEMAFPEPLCGNRMPLAANFVGCEKYPGKLHKGPYRGSFYSTLAAIINMDRRTLEQIDAKARARRRAFIFGTAVAIILMLSVALVFAVKSRQEAVAQRQEAVRQKEYAQEQAAIAERERQEAEAARRKLQLQYLEAIGEMSVADVLDPNAVPGGIKVADANVWTSLMRQRDLTFAVGREYQAGRILAAAHDGVLIGKNLQSAAVDRQSERFLTTALEWLRGPRGPQTVFITNAHCEWVTERNFRLPGRLKEQHYRLQVLTGAIDELQLKGAGVLVIGNAWGNFTAAELKAVERFVSSGGGLFVVGLGWSWRQDSVRLNFRCEGKTNGQNANDFLTYPMNRLVAPFGIEWTERF